MKRTLLSLAIVASLLGFTPAAAQAVNADGFGQQAVAVAKEGGCKNVRTRSDGGPYAYSGLVCDLRGQRLNILTFKNKAQEKVWLRKLCGAIPGQWVMIGYGYTITAKNGNRYAAKTGERVYGGDAYRCDEVI